MNDNQIMADWVADDSYKVNVGGLKPVEFRDFGVSPNTIKLGEDAEWNIEVYNPNDAMATVSIRVKMDGQTLFDKDVDLLPNYLYSNFERVTPDDTGSYTLTGTVGDKSKTASLTVEEAPTKELQYLGFDVSPNQAETGEVVTWTMKVRNPNEEKILTGHVKVTLTKWGFGELLYESDEGFLPGDNEIQYPFSVDEVGEYTVDASLDDEVLSDSLSVG